MSRPLDPLDPLGFGTERRPVVTRPRPLLPPGGTRRVVAELLDDDDAPLPPPAVVDRRFDDAFADLFAPTPIPATAPPEPDRWTVEHRREVETWWGDDTGGDEVTAHAPAHGRRTSRRAQHRWRGPLGAIGVAAALATGATVTPAVLHTVQANITAKPGVVVSVAPARMLNTWLYVAVYDRLVRLSMAVEDAGDRSDVADRNAQRTFVALTADVATQFGRVLSREAEARFLGMDADGALVELGPRYRTLSTQQKVLAIGQIVLSLDDNGVTPVRFVSERGTPIAVPCDDESYTTGPVSAVNYGYLVTNDGDYRPQKRARA